MHAADIYEEIVGDDRKMDPETAKRIMRFAAKTGNAKLAAKFPLRTFKENPELDDILADSNEVSILKLWFRIVKSPIKRKERVGKLETELLLDLIDAGVFSEEELKDFWKSKNPEIKLRVIEKGNIWSLPASWVTWFIKNFPFDDPKYGDTGEGFQQGSALAGMSRDNTRTWEAIASKAESLDLLTALSEGAHRDRWGTLVIRKRLLDKWIERIKEPMGAGDWFLLEHTLSIGSSADEKKWRDLLKEASSRISEDTPTDVKTLIEDLTGQRLTAKCLTLDDAVKALDEGVVDSIVISEARERLQRSLDIKGSNYVFSKEGLDLELFETVSKCSSLSAQQAFNLFKGFDNLGYRILEDLVRGVLKKKPLAWKKEFLDRQLRECSDGSGWGRRGSQAESLFREVFYSMSPKERRASLENYVKDKSELAKLVRIFAVSDDVWEAATVQTCGKAGPEVRKEIGKYLVNAFGDNAQAWEIFETLSEDFEGTLADLVRVCKHV